MTAALEQGLSKRYGPVVALEGAALRVEFGCIVGFLGPNGAGESALMRALLGDTDILVLDEPSNGLDPSGIAWLRAFLRGFADAGGAVQLSSHVLPEIEHAIDDVVLIDHGRTVWAGAFERRVTHGSPLEDAFLRLAPGGPLS